MGVIEASFGILSIVNENMVAAIRRASVERGLDPRDFALMALGGAGGLHVCRLAELLGTETVIVPQHSGVLSALGLVTTDLKNQFAQTMPQREGEFDVAAMETVYERLESAARVWFEEERIEPADQTVVRLADLRYANQGFELSVAMHEGVATEASLERLISRFHERHKELYTFNAIGAAVEIVTLRVEALGRRRALPSPRTASRGTEGSKDYVVGERLVHFDLSGPLQTRIIDREQLHPGWTAPGPLLIAEKFTTTLVPATWRCTVGDQGDLILKG
jgi:N-methylhydantoinase A